MHTRTPTTLRLNARMVSWSRRRCACFIVIDVDAAEWSDLVGIYLGNLYSGHHNVRVRFELFTIDVLTFVIRGLRELKRHTNQDTSLTRMNICSPSPSPVSLFVTVPSWTFHMLSLSEPHLTPISYRKMYQILLL